MKLMCYRVAGAPALGVVAGDGVVDVGAAVPDFFAALRPAGRDAVRRTAEACASLVGGSPEGVFVASTGVIGEAITGLNWTFTAPDAV